MLLLAMPLAVSCEDEEKGHADQEYPKFVEKGQIVMPTDCQVYKRGEVIPFTQLFTDNEELGNYNIEIHNNFDHHTHGTTHAECQMDAKKDPVKPWIYNQSFSIPAGQKQFLAKHDIKIPEDVDTGDYHFMIRLTDKVGFQSIRAVSIKIK